MIIYYLILLVMTLLGSVASLFLKKASQSNGIVMMVTNRNLYVGGFLYLASAILNIYVLRFLEYSVVLPLTSMTYIWTMLLSHAVLNERITGRKIVGLVLIILGAIIVSI